MGRRKLTPEENGETKKRKHSGLSPKELMAAIIDEDALKQRKENQISKAPRKQTIAKVIQEKRWWEDTIDVSDFTIVSSGSKFYAQLPNWKPTVWIGEYTSEEELMKVLADYSKSTHVSTKYKKSIPNLHTIVKKIDVTTKQ